MRVLLDTCVWGPAAGELAALGHDVVWCGAWPEDPGDDGVLARAHAEGRVLVTLDKDFGELAVLQAKPHSGIVRLVGVAARQQAAVCAQVLARFGAELLAGGIVTANPPRVRIRPASGA